MKVLLLSDVTAKKYYDYYVPGCLQEYELIISCGDLSAKYLEFMATMAHCPLLYVRGNHDDSLIEKPPEGCTCIEDRIFTYKGIRFLGLGGSYRYRDDGKNMYTEQEMKARIRKLFFRLKKNRGFDVLVTHAPVLGVGDMDHVSHKGFACFSELIEKYSPPYLFHGHVHLNYARSLKRKQKYKDTTIINAYEYFTLEL